MNVCIITVVDQLYWQPRYMYADQGLKNCLPKASICSCWASTNRQSLYHSGKCLFETKICHMCVRACLVSKQVKKIDFSCCLPILIICDAKLAVRAMPKAEIPYTPYANTTLQYCMPHCSIHVFRTPLTFLPIFLGKSVWKLKLNG